MRLSLRLKLTCWYAVSLIILLSIFCGLIDALMHNRLLARTDFELDEEVHELVRWPVERRRSTTFLLPAEILALEQEATL